MLTPIRLLKILTCAGFKQSQVVGRSPGDRDGCLSAGDLGSRTDPDGCELRRVHTRTCWATAKSVESAERPLRLRATRHCQVHVGAVQLLRWGLMRGGGVHMPWGHAHRERMWEIGGGQRCASQKGAARCSHRSSERERKKENKRESLAEQRETEKFGPCRGQEGVWGPMFLVACDFETSCGPGGSLGRTPV